MNASTPVSSFASPHALSRRSVIPSESLNQRGVLVTSCNLPFSSCRLPRHRASPSASHRQSLGSTPNFPLPNRTRPFDCPYNASSWQSIRHDQGGREVSMVVLVNWHYAFSIPSGREHFQYEGREDELDEPQEDSKIRF